MSDRAEEIAAALGCGMDATVAWRSARLVEKDLGRAGDNLAAYIEWTLSRLLIRESQPEPNPPTNSESSGKAAPAIAVRMPPKPSSAPCMECGGSRWVSICVNDAQDWKPCPVCSSESPKRWDGTPEPAAPAVGEDEALLARFDVYYAKTIMRGTSAVSMAKSLAEALREAITDVARTEKALAKWRDECARWRDKYDADVARMHSDIETLEHNARVGGEREEELERERDEARAALALVEEEKEKAVADEREACALVAQNGRFLSNESMEYKWGMACAAAIRARAGRNDG